MKIRFVDATRIRNTIDTDFTGVGTHADYPYIPLGELWISKSLKDEKAVFVALWKLERSMRGKPFRLIREKAKKTLTTPKKTKVAVKKTMRKGTYKIVFVDGATVRAGLDPYFLLGGHGLVYPYIPKNEIWIDTKQDPSETKYTILHEMDEHQRMSKGMSYDDAHDFALAVERMHRRKDGVADFTRG
ncbi:hypothetical protein KJ781_03035 [Patescibacteria group bacterium]|nr:hypothetical protein [Patescibacteria group bacterium]MBU1448586.1 hypothetical protein [Patescibacteria group bacterium]MBU2613266.1 hypothetical protein [Patescibacteria group bacterium]